MKRLEVNNQMLRHHKRLDEINKIKIRFGEKFSMNKRSPGEVPFFDLLKQRHHNMEYNYEYRKNEKEKEITKCNARML
jgi:hypothetical protein